MPVQFRRDELVNATPTTVIEEEDEGGMLSGLGLSLLAGLPVAIVAAILLMPGLTALKKTMIAADELRERHSGDNWQEVWTPIMLFVFYGAIVGAAIAWRIAAKTGMGGGLICVPVALLAAIA